MSAKRLLLPLTLITLAGAALRFYQLNSIPAGLHYDIAANAILVEDIALRGYRPAFISAYTGKEVLFFYSAAALFRLIGSSVFALRATAAFWGVLTIPITYFALRQLLRHQRHSRWLAAFGAAMLAFSFAHLVWSRFGLRAITQPAVQAMAVGFIFRALRAGRTRDFW
ncbi:MAG TPA: phospholipid carrier-dependent glycosyltransferase, partial [Anaerolineales bacterium]|nr:phospholipid carrier-dependent glycosyltransferase [Anaerolineales bacterium]